MQTVLPIKVRVLAYLSVPNSTADCRGLANLMHTNEDNLRAYLGFWEENGIIQRVNPGSRPVMYELTDKGKEELVLVGRRR